MPDAGSVRTVFLTYHQIVYPRLF